MSNSKVIDVSSFQGSSKSYFETFKKYGAKSAIVKLTQGTNYVNPKASLQVINAYKVFGSVAAYHYYMGNPIAEAKYFLAHVRAFGLDKTTWLAIDVEDPSLPEYNTTGVNKFLEYLYNEGYHNLLCYASASWFEAGRINRAALTKKAKIWCAAYNNSQPGINGVAVWQQSDNWHGVDMSIDFNDILTSKSVAEDNHHKVSTKPSYYQDNGLYEVITDEIHAYKKLPLKGDKNKRYVRWEKGSRFYAVAVKNGDIYSLKTAVGYTTANKDYVKLIKKI